LDIPNSDYLVLESLNQTKDNSNYKSIHIVKIQEGGKVTLGRGHDCDIRINDISVSRKHACLEFNNSNIVLKDLYSKFGTLVLLQDNVPINENSLYLQVGRTFSKFALEKKLKTNTSQKEASSHILKDSNQPTINRLPFQIPLADNLNIEAEKVNISKPKALFKVEKVDNASFKNLRENDYNGKK